MKYIPTRIGDGGGGCIDGGSCFIGDGGSYGIGDGGSGC